MMNQELQKQPPLYLHSKRLLTSQNNTCLTPKAGLTRAQAKTFFRDRLILSFIMATDHAAHVKELEKELQYFKEM
jgi:hypothetical protein